MEKFQILREDALKNYRMADHMLHVTYPLIKDTKLLLGVAINIYHSHLSALSSILHHDHLFKLVPLFEDSFESKILVFQKKCLNRHKINKDLLNSLLELKEIMDLHKNSPVEFRHKDRFIICTNNYKIQAITTNQLKLYLQKTRKFLDLMNKITLKNERIFRRS
ncbi:hypothetical protein HOC13_03630 [Candidatus Woesearchaeota archaeon]|jgi:hypothetical protein|nr:hypothetical protein [Candidatus Woesearchaeota archaeon]